LQNLSDDDAQGDDTGVMKWMLIPLFQLDKQQMQKSHMLLMYAS
jgi:hypothetical protein